MCDIDHSRSLLLESAELEYPPAQYKLAYCYEYGHLGFEIDIVSFQIFTCSLQVLLCIKYLQNQEIEKPN